MKNREEPVFSNFSQNNEIISRWLRGKISINRNAIINTGSCLPNHTLVMTKLLTLTSEKDKQMEKKGFCVDS